MVFTHFKHAHKVLIVLMALTFLIGCCAFSISMQDDVQFVAEAGANSSEGTLLESNTGLQVGYNTLSTGSYDNSSTPGNDSDLGASKQGFDFFATDGASAGFLANNHVIFHSGSLATMPMLSMENEYNGVASAIADRNVTTTVTFSAKIRIASGTAPLKLSMYWYPNGKDNEYLLSNEVSQTLNSSETTISITLGGDAGTINMDPTSGDYEHYITYYGGNRLFVKEGESLESPCFLIKINDGGTNVSNVYLSNPKITVDVDMGISFDTESVSVSVSGKNRAEKTISNALTTNASELANLYVKAGDIITITSYVKLDLTQEKYDYPSYYTRIFDTYGKSCIDWYAYDGDYGGSNISYTSRLAFDKDHDGELDLFNQSSNNFTYVDPSSDSFGYNMYCGYIASFVVDAGVANAVNGYVNLAPRVINGVHNGNKTYAYGNNNGDAIKIRVDATAPSSPIIDENSDLGKAIANNSWYTETFEMQLEYDTSVIKNVRASEKVYAFVLHNSVSTVDFDRYNFAENINAPYNYTYYVDNGYGVSTATQGSAPRQNLGAYNNNADQKTAIDFSEKGIYTLVLFAVDSAGNVSLATIYSVATGNEVRIDAEDIDIGFEVYFRDNQYSYDAASVMFNRSYVFVGDEYHKTVIEGGAVKTIFTAEDKDYLQSKYVFLRGEGTAKREQWVTIRLVMRAQQYNNYNLVSYTNEYEISSSSPQYRVVRNDNESIRYYEITYLISDDVKDKESGVIKLYFHRRANIENTQEDYTFTLMGDKTPVPVDIAGDLRAYYTQNVTKVYLNPVPDFNVSYYKPIQFDVYVAYSEPDAEGKRYPINGGYIVYNGIRYKISNDISLRDVSTGVLDITLYDDGNNEVAKLKSAYPIKNTYRAESEAQFIDGIYHGVFIVTGIDMMLASEIGYVDAGKYFYTAEIDSLSATSYYGELFSEIEIKKADPEVIEPFAKSSLIYGQSLADLGFNSYDGVGGAVITDEMLFVDTIYQRVHSGVYGHYEIINPEPGTPDYIRHDVNDKVLVTITFYPIDVSMASKEQISQNWEYYERFYSPIKDLNNNIIDYELIPGTQHSGNYNQRSYAVYVKIEHANAEINIVADSDNYVYDGTPKTLEPYAFVRDANENEVKLEDVEILMKYRPSSAGEDTPWDLLPPTIAGTYIVSLQINSQNSNYKSEETTRFLTIARKTLDVMPVDNPNQESITPAQFGDVMVSERLTYTYGKLSRAFYKASYVENSIVVDVPLNVANNYVYSFKKVRDALGQSVNEDWTESVNNITNNMLDAGTYVMKASINNSNYEGERNILVVVNRAIVTLSSDPKPIATYTAYARNNINLGENRAHLEYGMTLKEASEIMLDFSSQPILAYYTFGASTEKNTIPGRFYYQDEISYYNNQGIYSNYPRNAYGEVILPVKYDTVDPNVLSYYSLLLYWEAGSYVDGNFVADTNYAIVSNTTDVIVTKATPDFSALKLSTITYGDALSMSIFEGEITAVGGFVLPRESYTLSKNQDENLILNGGNTTVPCSFIVNSSEYSDNYRSVTSGFNVPITVEKKAVEITIEGLNKVLKDDYNGAEDIEEAISHVFGTLYNTPTYKLYAKNTTDAQAGDENTENSKGEEIKNKNIQVDFKYYSGTDAIYITNETWVGLYSATATINNGNYVGSVEFKFVVVKAELKLSEEIGEIIGEYGTSLGELFNKNVMLTDSIHNIHGNLTFKDKDTKPNVGNSTEYEMVFTAESSYTELYNTNFKPFTSKVTPVIEKKTLDLTIEGLEHKYDESAKKVTCEVVNPENPEEKLPIVITYKKGQETIASAPTEAGLYRVTVEIDSSVANYRAKSEVVMTISKADINISEETITLVYNGKAQNARPEYTTSLVGKEIVFDDENYTVNYYDYSGINKLNYVPSAVGKYYVDVVISTSNYYGITANRIEMIIKPDMEATLDGLNQTYCPPSTDINAEVVRPVTVVFNDVDGAPHPAVNYSVTYRKVGESDYSDYFNTNAGSYDVKVAFNENGYTEVITATMVIAKKSIDVPLRSEYRTTYTASAIMFNINNELPNPVIDATYKFRAYGSQHEFVANSQEHPYPVNAGEYEVEITLKDVNYQGVGYTKLVIERANLIIPEDGLPFVKGSIYYSANNESVEFMKDAEGVNTGKVYFGGVEMKRFGSWHVLKTENGGNDISRLSVGNHNVDVTFVLDETFMISYGNDANGDAIYREEYASNFNPVTTTLAIRIEKRNIGEFITFVESSLLHVYTTETLKAEAYILSDANIVEGYPTISLRINYGAAGTAGVVEVGTYNDVRAEIVDANYTGTSSPVTLKVLPATPTVILPTHKVVDIHTTLTNDKLNKDGSAYIVKNSGEHVLVDGSFTIYGEYNNMVMDKANNNVVFVTFTPTLTSSYNVVTTAMDIFVTGETVTVTNVTATLKAGMSNAYGVKLSAFELTGNTSIDGTIQWMNPDYVPNVGEVVYCEFIPSDAYIDTHNIVTNIPVTISVAQGEANVNSDVSEVRVYVGKTLKDYILTLDIRDTATGEAITGYKYEIRESENVGVDFNRVITDSDVETSNFLRLNVHVTHANYAEITASIVVRAFYLIEEDAFSIANKNKDYDGENVEIEDLGISVGNTLYPLSNDKYHIVSILKNGVQVEEARDPGEYQITIVIDERTYDELGNVISYGAYDGATTFTYVISRKNISDSISVTNNQKEYASSSGGVVISFGDYVVDMNTVNVRYESADGNNLGSVVPSDTGVYKVYVNITTDNKYYSGSAIFDYVVTKRNATVTLLTRYDAQFGTDVEITPELSNNLGAGDYVVEYYDRDNAIVVGMPKNAGTYRVVVTIKHKNYQGSATSTLVISQATLVNSELPTLSVIKYGQTLANSTISGGEMRANDSTDEVIAGEFAFVDPTRSDFEVGTNRVEVVFKPHNKNYANFSLMLEIEVTKATASISFADVRYVYNGERQLPIVITSPVKNLGVEYTLYKDGLPINEARVAGEYKVKVTIIDDCYVGTTLDLYTFVIEKASLVLEETTLPTAGAIVYEQALNTSVLMNANMVYVSGKSGIAGTFTYDNPGSILGDVGSYLVGYTFTPNDVNNYNVYKGMVSVQVNQKEATIMVYDTTFTYGDLIMAPRFVTNPVGLNVVNSEFDSALVAKEIKNVGIYQFTANIVEKNYKGSVVYSIEIRKKAVKLSFVLDGNPVGEYRTTYGNVIYAKAKINPMSLDPIDVSRVEDIQASISYYYGSGVPQYGLEGFDKFVPRSVGNYYVVAQLAPTEKNYTIDLVDGYVPYYIAKARVQTLEVDRATLIQTYGDVKAPRINTTPSGVKVRVTYNSAGETLPTKAGTHSIKIVVVDENYWGAEVNTEFQITPKAVSIIGIKAFDKTFDGLSVIDVVGSLEGVMAGDQVALKMTATTLDGKTNVGSHAIDIKSWELTGLDAKNYTLNPPLGTYYAKILTKKVEGVDTNSYILMNDGFSANITFTCETVNDVVNKTTILSKLAGQDATVRRFSIQENGVHSVLEQKVKFYVEIPEEYLNSRDFGVEAIGDLANSNIVFIREGNYMTFYADRSGEIIFYNNSFPYWLIIVAGVILIVILGVVMVILFSPIRKRKKLSRGVREAYSFNQYAEEAEARAVRARRARAEEKKRRWRY